jgi:hypothetical protein
MNKKSIGVMAAMAAIVGMGATPQQIPTQQSQPTQNQRHNEATDKQLSPVQKGQVTPLNPSGLIGEDFGFSHWRSPKEYGQWLQSAGRQKWVKSKRK